MGADRRQSVRPSAAEWSDAIERLRTTQLELGWIPPSAIEHAASELNVTSDSVRLRVAEARRVAAEPWRSGLPAELAIPLASCRDFRDAATTLQRRGVPPLAIEAALWATSDRLVGSLKARELARRAEQAAAGCPFCRTTINHH
jgi:hypothetical protein